MSKWWIENTEKFESLEEAAAASEAAVCKTWWDVAHQLGYDVAEQEEFAKIAIELLSATCLCLPNRRPTEVLEVKINALAATSAVEKISKLDLPQVDLLKEHNMDIREFVLVILAKMKMYL